MADAQTSLPSSFAKTPNIANEARARFEASDAGRSLQPQPQPMETQHVEAPGSVHVTSQDLPQLEKAPETAPQPQQETQPAQQPEPQPVPQPDYPQYNRYYEQQMMQQMAAERDQLRQQLAQMQEQQRQYQEQQQLNDIYNQLAQSPEFEQLESVDPDDARRIMGATAKLLNARLNSVQQQLDSQRQETQRNFYNFQAQAEGNRARQVSETILKAHPDFFDLYKDPAFVQYLNGHDGYNSMSRNDAATAEFYRGNSDYVIDLVNRFKQSRNPNSARQIQSTPPVQVASAATAPAQPQAPRSNYTLAELNTLAQTRQISQDQYRQMLKDWKAANQAR